MATTLARPGYRALRRGRLSLRGQIYLVTFTTHGRRPLFRDFTAGCAACCSMTDARLWVASRLTAWVLMPDHWHGLIELGKDQCLSATVRRLKSNSSRAAGSVLGGSTRIWADGFHDHAVRSDEALIDVARYVVLNPVRAGLVDSAWRYPFWNADWISARD
jgi:REP element-mobilizing transposase RayT